MTRLAVHFKVCASDLKRFEKLYVVQDEKKPGYEHLEGTCWIWQEAPDVGGYGTFSISDGAKFPRAHRYSYQAYVGPLPGSLDLDHRCHERLCVNPQHLRPATGSQNCQNLDPKKVHSNTGVRGVSWNKKNKRYIAQGIVNGKQKYLGSFKELEEAEAFMSQWRAENLPYSYEAGLKQAVAA